MPKDLAAEKAIAYSLYFSFVPHAKILKKVNIASKTLTGWITKWKPERALVVSALIEEARDRNQTEIMDIFGLGVPLIKKSLVERANSDKPLDMKECQQLTQILMEFDKLQRLEIGKPTEIHSWLKPASIDDLKKALEHDEFIDVTELQNQPKLKYDRNGTPHYGQGRENVRGHDSRQDESNPREDRIRGDSKGSTGRNKPVNDPMLED